MVYDALKRLKRLEYSMKNEHVEEGYWLKKA